MEPPGKQPFNLAPPGGKERGNLQWKAEKLPTRVVAVYRDEALRATAIAYRMVPPMPDLADPRKAGEFAQPTSKPCRNCRWTRIEPGQNK
jgi:hypothetical protein